MQKSGYHIIPVNPNVTEVLGEKAYASLKEVDHTIDIINVFRRPEHLPEIAKEAAQTDCRVFWARSEERRVGKECRSRRRRSASEEKEETRNNTHHGSRE